MNSFEGGSGDKKEEVTTLKPQSFFDWTKLNLPKADDNYSPMNINGFDNRFDIDNFKCYLSQLMNNPKLEHPELNRFLAFVFVKKLETYKDKVNDPEELLKFVLFTFIVELRQVLQLLETYDPYARPDEDSLSNMEILINNAMRMEYVDSFVCASNISNLLSNPVMHFIYDYARNDRKQFTKFIKEHIGKKEVNEKAEKMLEDLGYTKKDKPGNGAVIIPFPKKPRV